MTRPASWPRPDKRADDGNSYRYHATGLPAGGDKAPAPLSDPDHEWREEQHRRRAHLLMLQHENTRRENSAAFWFIMSSVLLILALAMAVA